MKIRIKTEEEFLKEFGKGWRSSVRAGFTKEMDEFLGTTTTLSVENVERLNLHKHIEFSIWNFSPDMYIVIERDLPQTFPKTNNKSYILI